MKKYVLDSLIKLINKSYPEYSELQLKTIRYGLEGIYISVTKTVIIFIIAFLLNILKQLLIIVILYNFLRMFSFGSHANNSLSCLILSASIFIGTAYLCTIVTISKLTKIIIFSICTLIFIKCAPADTKKRPIISLKRRMIYKFISILIIAIYGLILITTNDNFISNAIFSAITIQSFLISPLSYYLFKQPYNNYLY